MTAGRAALIGLLAWVVVGCKAREDAFYDRVYSCDNNARGDTCGTTRQGQPMTCFAASQLGGEDFCAEACDPALASADPAHFKCLSSGALLRICHPHGGAVNPDWRCPAGLECYRTDLLSDEGLCVQMHVCTEDSDCGEKRPVCAARLLRERSPSLAIATDNLQCVQSMCGAGKAMCPPGEQCLASYFDGVAGVRHLCPQLRRQPALSTKLHVRDLADLHRGRRQFVCRAYLAPVVIRSGLRGGNLYRHGSGLQHVRDPASLSIEPGLRRAQRPGSDVRLRRRRSRGGHAMRLA